MIEEVTRYQTKDGKLHVTEEKAQEHIVETLGNLIGPILDKTGIGHRDKLKVADALFGTTTKANTLRQILDKML
jgi:hypothetical protein